MQEKPPFSSHLDFFPNVKEGGYPLPYPPLRTFNLPSGTPLDVLVRQLQLFQTYLPVIATLTDMHAGRV